MTDNGFEQEPDTEELIFPLEPLSGLHEDLKEAGIPDNTGSVEGTAEAGINLDDFTRSGWVDPNTQPS